MLPLSALLNPIESDQNPQTDIPPGTIVQHNIRINRLTVVNTLYIYPPGTSIEYPETGPGTGQKEAQSVGHLFWMDPAIAWNAQLPTKGFAYSSGEPSGKSPKGHECFVLYDKNGKSLTNCSSSTKTCTLFHSITIKSTVSANTPARPGQGVKACPFVQPSTAHVSASRQALEVHLQYERSVAQSSPSQDVFEKTLALWAFLRDQGCTADVREPTVYTELELSVLTAVRRTPTKAKRGHITPKCQGRILWDYNSSGLPYIR